MATFAHEIPAVPGQSDNALAPRGTAWRSVYVDATDSPSDVYVGLAQKVARDTAFRTVPAGTAKLFPIPDSQAVAIQVNPDGPEPSGQVVYWAAIDVAGQAFTALTKVQVSAGQVTLDGIAQVELTGNPTVQVDTSGGPLQVSAVIEAGQKIAIDTGAGPVAVNPNAAGSVEVTGPLGDPVPVAGTVAIDTQGGPVAVAIGDVVQVQGAAGAPVEIAINTDQNQVLVNNPKISTNPLVVFPSKQVTLNLSAGQSTIVILLGDLGEYEEVTLLATSTGANLGNYTFELVNVENSARGLLTGGGWSLWNGAAQSGVFRVRGGSTSVRQYFGVLMAPAAIFDGIQVRITASVNVANDQVTLQAFCRWSSSRIINDTGFDPAQMQPAIGEFGTMQSSLLGSLSFNMTSSASGTVFNAGGAVKHVKVTVDGYPGLVNTTPVVVTAMLSNGSGTVARDRSAADVNGSHEKSQLVLELDVPDGAANGSSWTLTVTLNVSWTGSVAVAGYMVTTANAAPLVPTTLQ